MTKEVDELRRLVREKYPFPIAHFHKKTLGVLDDNIEKLKCVLETGEMVIQFLALLSLAQLRQDLEDGRVPVSEGLSETVQLANPSFGKWYGLSRDIMKNYRNRRDELVVPELFDFWFRKPAGKKLRLQKFHSKVAEPFMKLRNDFHHGRIPDDKVTGSVERALALLHQILEQVAFLSDYQLSFVQRILVETDANRKTCFVHDLKIFNGCFSYFDTDRWQSEINLETGIVILLASREKRYLTLSPFVVFSSQVKDIPDVYPLNNYSRNRGVYVSTQFGRELDTNKWEGGNRHLEELADFFTKLRSTENPIQPIEIEDKPSVQDESRLPTPKVFEKKYRQSANIPEHKSPYKFLDYYNPEDTDIFFGRDKEIRLLWQKFHSARLFILHGESGTGKTSLIRAGLIPKLPADTYVPVYVRVLKNPVGEIKRELVRQLNRDGRHTDLPLSQFLIQETELLSKTVVIVLDQFEEFFLRFPEEVRKDFENELGACMETPRLDVKILISLRADYFSFLAQFESAIPQIFVHQIRIAHLTEAQAREAIMKPPEGFGMSVDENMVDAKLLPELASAEGVEAPLMQIVCDALYQNALGEGVAEITMADYEAVGDVRGALVNYLDSKLREFGLKQRRAKAVLKALVTAEGTKRASFAGELVSRMASLGMDMEETELAEFLNKFVTGRLVRVEDVEGGKRFELSHEYLVRHIREWIASSERETTKILELIDRAYEAYQVTGLLLEKSALDMIAPFETRLVLSCEKSEFLNKSKNQAKKTRRGLLLKIAVMLISVALSVGGFFGYQAYDSYEKMKVQKRFAEERQRKAEQERMAANYNLAKMYEEKAGKALEDALAKREPDKNFPIAWLYTLEALKQDIEPSIHLPVSMGRLHRSELRNGIFRQIWSSDSTPHLSAVRSVAFGPDGNRIVSGSSDKTIRIWDAKTGKELEHFAGHSDIVSKAVFSPDGKHIASASGDKTVRIWDVETGKEIIHFTGHSSSVYDVAFSPDGKLLASCSADESIRLWDIETGTELMNFAGHQSRVYAIAFDPDGKRIVSVSGDKTIRLWDIQTGKQLMPFLKNPIVARAVAFHPDGKRIVSESNDHSIKLWDIETGEVPRQFPGHTSAVYSVAFDPEGKRIVAGSWENGTRVWDLETGRELAHFGNHSPIRSVGFSPDGKQIITGSEDNTIRLWELETGLELTKYSGHLDNVNCVAFSPNGKRAASGSNDHSIVIWNVETGKAMNRLRGHTSSVSGLAFSSDGRLLASGAKDNMILLWNADSGLNFKSVSADSPVNCIAFSPDGLRVVAGLSDNSVKIWDSRESTLKTFGEHKAPVTCVAFSPNGKHIASGSEDRSVRLWNAGTGQIMRLYEQPSFVHSICFGPNGQWVATASGDMVRIWYGERKPKTLSGHTDSVYGVACSPDGKYLASGSKDKTIRVWNVETGIELTTFSGHESFVSDIAFSPDGKRIISGAWDHTVRLWDVEAVTKPTTISGHTFISVDFCPDGKRIVTGSADNEVITWNVETGRQLARYSGHSGAVFDTVFSPDGRKIASGSADGTIRILNAETGHQLAVFSGHSSGEVHSVAFRPDGESLVSGASDNTVRLWEIESGKNSRIFSGHSSFVYDATFSPDGEKIASGSKDQTIRLWDVETGRELKVFSGHSSFVTCVAFSPDGKMIVSGSTDNTARLWEIETGEEFTRFSGHSSFVCDVDFGPNGKMVVTCSDDKTIRLWDIETGKELVFLSGHSDTVNSVSFDPTRMRVASASKDKTIRFWTLDLYDLYAKKEDGLSRSDDLYRLSFELMPYEFGEFKLLDAPKKHRIPISGKRSGNANLKVYPDKSNSHFASNVFQ